MVGVHLAIEFIPGGGSLRWKVAFVVIKIDTEIIRADMFELNSSSFRKMMTNIDQLEVLELITMLPKKTTAFAL
jgi:hypothetical protein